MTEQQTLELMKDRAFERFLRGQCRRHSSREDLADDFYSAAWAWIGTSAPDDLPPAQLRRQALNAITRAYRHELKQRKLAQELGEAYTIEGTSPGVSIPCGRSAGEQIAFQAHAFIQEIEPGLLLPLPQGSPGPDGDDDVDW